MIHIGSHADHVESIYTNTSGVVHLVLTNSARQSAIFSASFIDVMDFDDERRISRPNSAMVLHSAALMPPYSSSWHAYLQQRTSEALGLRQGCRPGPVAELGIESWCCGTKSSIR